MKEGRKEGRKEERKKGRKKGRKKEERRKKERRKKERRGKNETWIPFSPGRAASCSNSLGRGVLCTPLIYFK